MFELKIDRNVLLRSSGHWHTHKYRLLDKQVQYICIYKVDKQVNFHISQTTDSFRMKGSA